ncbi:MAG: nickel-dependent hydrogenase large subunit [Proteobacteria bacterium]|nr:nickel-dependent hydrogenase large subunit [Pseudomonadota bacterium]MBU1640632.1 nickel-dependent hydrogenase large subunit [Pseudomonadota bacterium]
MKISCEVDVRHLTRVEGHGNIRISIKNGEVKEARWEVVETPRFFEAMLVGKLYENAPYISGRICGICSIGHTLASIRAIENGFGFTPSVQTARLRLLLKHMETLQSHILHIYFLAAPDFLGVGSVLPLTQSHPEVVQQALRLKMLANDLCDEVGGRRLHPTRTVVGGFTMLPEKYTLGQFRQRLVASLADLAASAALFASFTLPDFSRETEFVSLRQEGAYPFIGGNLLSTDGVLKKEHEYRAMTNEYMADYSTSKLSRLSRKSLAVGALARINNNFAYLRPKAAAIAGDLGLRPISHNPFMNTIAQLVECVHVVEESIVLIDELLAADWQEPRQLVQPRAGIGVGAVEVPRGILYHCLHLDGDGRIEKADCVIPTSQNHANIYHDIEDLALFCAEQGKSDMEIEHLAEMLVRAYDPCISCSVH